MKDIKFIYDGIPYELCDIEGWYFKSDHLHEPYVVYLSKRQPDKNAVVNVCVLSGGFNETESGTKIKVPEFMLISEFFKLDVWSKYYFPIFSKERRQWYHTEKHNNPIKAMAEVMEFALHIGITEGGVTLY